MTTSFQSGSLDNRDYENLSCSWITPELAQRACLRRVTSIDGRSLVGRNGSGDYAGIAFPYKWPGEEHTREYRLRLDNPPSERQQDGSIKEKGKYLSPPGRGSLLYFAPGTSPALLADNSIPLVITEGEKKTLALFRLSMHDCATARFLPAGVSGVWNFRTIVGKTNGPNGERRDVKGVIPDFDRIELKERKVFIIFDSNAAENPSVNAARAQLTRELRARGSLVAHVTVPMREGLNGVDDWLAMDGPDAVLAAMEAAKASDHDPLPKGFEIKRGSLYKTRDGEDSVFICGQLEVRAWVRDGDQAAWSKLPVWRDKDGVEHRWVMPMGILAGDRNELLRHLLDLGLKINVGLKHVGDEIAIFIDRCDPVEHIRCVQRVGWFNSSFVLPDQCFSRDGFEAIMFYSENPAANAFRVQGTLDDWQQNVGLLCVGNSRLTFAVSCAFAGPLLRPLDELGGGFHLRGTSSLGKTTALLAGGSVWGGGGKDGFGRTWRATHNGLESIAPLHNDGFLALDEIGQVPPIDAGKAAYLLANGQTTLRATRTGGARKSEEFTLLFLSTGEISLSNHVRQGGQHVRGGQEVRMCDIPADAGRGLGLFEDLKGRAGAADLANTLRSAAIKYYGSPIRAFLSGLVHSEWRDDTKRLRRDFASAICELHGLDLSSEVQRAASRFGLVAAAGELATAFGVTGWPEGEATTAALSCFTAWLESRGGSGAMDDQTAIDQVRGIIEAHGHSRFEPFPAGKEQKILSNRLGYRYTDPRGRTEYWFLKAAFGEELRQSGRDIEPVAKALKDAGFLKTTASTGKLTSRLQYRVPMTIPEFGNRPWVYAVLPSILGPEEEIKANGENT